MTPRETDASDGEDPWDFYRDMRTWQTTDARCRSVGKEYTIQFPQADLLLYKVPLRAFTAVDQILCIVESNEQTQLGIERRRCENSDIPGHSRRIRQGRACSC